MVVVGATAGSTFPVMQYLGVTGPANTLSLVAAAAADAAVNIALLVPLWAQAHNRAGSDLLREMAPTVAPALAFSLVGILLGNLLSSYGAAALVLLLVPILIANTVFSSADKLKRARAGTVEAFLLALEAHDRYTGLHSRRVGEYATWIGEELALPRDRLATLRDAALLHDVGKLATPLRLLNKPGRLTDSEYAEVKLHDEICHEILSRVEFLTGLLGEAPGDKGRRPEVASGTADHDHVSDPAIVHIADAFDAMTSTRAYRKALPMEVAFDELRKHAGVQFHERGVDALFAALTSRKLERGLGHEVDAVAFAVEPPTVGVGSAGLGGTIRDADIPSMR